MSAVDIWNGSAFVAPSALKTWSGSAFVPATGAYVWTGSAFEKVWPSGPAFDAVGPGWAPSTRSTTPTWSHTATAGAYVIVAVGYSATISSVKYGTTAMTLLATVTDAAGEKLSFYGLAGVAGGAQTVTITYTTSVFSAANSISLTNVTTVATPVGAAIASSTTLSQAVSIGTAKMIVQGFEEMSNQDLTAASGGTNRYRGVALAISTATATTTFTATQTSAAAGSGMYALLS